MKITIDTKEDSHDDIKKVIELLSKFLNHEQSTNNIFEQQTPAMNNLMSMFEEKTETAPIAQPEQKSTPNIEWY
ncbi:MAG TPA: hypothetical protein VJB66_05140 [Candidatus Nanoarchaeia archaeon]|nr:hypothetical protein [Candidatus Nanoarchaeia archaeon]